MIFKSRLADNVMKKKIYKFGQSNSASNADYPQADQSKQKLVYSRPVMTSYGPLSKNISSGFGGGTETDSTFVV